jgi:probable rRNA maturation factor
MKALSERAQLWMDVQNVSTLTDIPSNAHFKKWARKAIDVNAEITLRIVDEAEARELNKAYRGKDYATNVLTFPLMEEPFIMADIVICAPVVAKEAKEQNKTLEAHFAHLIIHGVLHAHGYDHEVPEQAELMESIETQTLTNLGYANPYLD